MNRLIDLLDIQERIGRKSTWIWNEIAHGRFPKPLPLKTSKNLWVESEIDAWLENFISRARQSQEGESATTKRTEKARAARMQGAA